MGLLEMNSADARMRGIADGAQVRVFNQRGDILLKARIDGMSSLAWFRLGFIGLN